MALCSVCESTGVPVKKNGDLWKHDTPDGDRCSNIKTEEHDNGSNLLPEGPTVVTNDSGEDEEISNVVSLSDLSVEEDLTIFKFTLTVSNPCPYLGNKSWHESNKQLATNRATQAGKNPVEEARYIGSVERGRKVVLTYEVPVK